MLKRGKEPKGRKGDGISLETRVITAADRFDALKLLVGDLKVSRY